MNITFQLTILALLTGLPILNAKEADKAKSADAPAAAEGSAGWESVEPLLQGPSARPKSKEEAIEIYTKYLAELEDKAAAFLKANPEDAHRWDLMLHMIKIDKMREFVGGEASAPEKLAKDIESILAAKDASEETKGFASYIQVMEAGEDEEKFAKLAGAHIKAFPKFEGNAQIEGKIKAAEMSKTLKEKPLELAFTSTDGKEVDMAKLRGKVVLIDFWATWCGPCVKEIPNVVATYNKLHDQGFEIVGISFDQDKDKLAAMTKDKNMPWPQYFDGKGWENKFGQLYGISSIPAMWLIDKKGMLVDTEGREDLANKVAKLLAE